MKRIGTFSSAAGLIFLGAWMIISKINPDLGKDVFKWWPAVIIILGFEIMIHFMSKSEERIKINYLVIPVLLILLFVNIFQGITGTFRNIVNNIHFSTKPIINVSGIDFNSYKFIETEKTIPVFGNKLYFNANNAKINIIRTNDKTIRFAGKIYLNHNSYFDKYVIMESKVSDGYLVEIKDTFVRAVELDIHIPYGYNYKVDCSNLDIRSDNKDLESSAQITGSNCNIKLEGLKSLMLDINNGNVNLKNIMDLRVKSNNSNIEVGGDTGNIDIDSSLGRVDINNIACSNINVVLRQGVVNLDTDDKNIDLKIDLLQGVASVNSEKAINSGISRTFGTGKGKVSIKMNQGAISFKN